VVVQQRLFRAATAPTRLAARLAENSSGRSDRPLPRRSPPDPAIRVHHPLDGLPIGEHLEDDRLELAVEHLPQPLLPNGVRVAAHETNDLVPYRGAA
jgi:hypothetical protein